MITRISLILAAAATLPAQAQQPYPTKPVRIIAPFTSGGPVDISARILAQKLNEAWGQQIIVENRAGARGTIGADAVAKSTPDGYTVLLTSSAHVITPSILPKVPYDPIRDFAPVYMVMSSPLVLMITPSLPVNNVREFIALAKARPGELSFASGGAGSSTHFTPELLKSVTGTKMVHVPYKGQSQAITDLIAGQIPFMLNAVPTVMEFIHARRLRALAITAEKRVAPLPAVPTFAESGYKEMTTGSWYAVWLPAKTPEPVVARWVTEVGRIVSLPDVRMRIIDLGGEPVSGTPAQLDAFQKSEAVRWAKVIRDSGAAAQ
jgi:tripartite-type tricarboxylate transporter receptor subunit TctC